jgi:hypothetical protein
MLQALINRSQVPDAEDEEVEVTVGPAILGLSSCARTMETVVDPDEGSFAAPGEDYMKSS